MTIERPQAAIRPPVMLGCTAVVAGVALIVVVVVFAIAFLDSGADSGEVTLQDARAYPPGSFEYIGQHNFYIVRLPDNTLVALSDLDAANRASTQRRCRVAEIGLSDPQLPALLQRLGARMSPQARGSTLLLSEDCNHAVYDQAGLRLDADGPNLDRYATKLDSQGRVVVSLTKRTCSERSEETLFAPATCTK
jgi:hypothetical protein